MITSLRATSRTIADYLQAAFVADPNLNSAFKPGGGMGVWLNTPADMAPTRAGLSVWLYRIVRDDSTLNRPPVRIAFDLYQPIPLPVRLHYLFTPVTNVDKDDSLETEQVILGKVLQCFHDHPELKGTDLSDDFAGTDTVVTARLEMLTLDEMSRVWDALEVSYRACLTYEVTVVYVGSGLQPLNIEPVSVPIAELGILVGGGS